MAINSTQEKLEQLEEEEEEEALSLCDLPVNLIDDLDQSIKPNSDIIESTQEEFDFRSWVGPFCKEPEMCVADEVFFQGQILPLPLSIATNTSTSQRDGLQFNFNRCESRSESLEDQGSSLSEFQSNSSRSSSLRSQNSSSSSSCSTTTTTTPIIPKPIVQDQLFHMHSSPKPQRRVTIPSPRQSSFGNQGRKSSSLELFRLGVVPAPEIIGMQDLNKVRSTTNSSVVNGLNANSTTTSVKMSYDNDTNHSGKRNRFFKQLVGKGGGLWSGCKCSVETVHSNNVIMIRSGTGTKSTHKTTESTTHAVKEKVFELKRQKNRQKQGKKTMLRHRTLEWIKELSHVSYPEDEALLSNS